MLLLFCCLSAKMAKFDQPRRGWFREGRFQPPIPYSIVTEADTWEELRANVREAVLCHFDEGKAPAVICLHRVLDELIERTTRDFNAKTQGRSAASRNQSAEPELKICH
jgi:hypothetical protein